MRYISPQRKAKQVLLGTMFGDGSIQKVGKSNGRFITGHSSIQFEHMLWKMKMLYPIVKDFGFYIKSSLSYSKHPIYWVRTLSSKYLGDIFKDMYRERKKVVRINNLRKLTPLGIATWYQDDGCLVHYNKKPWSVRFCTHGFTKIENELICDFFKEKHSLNFHVLKQNSGGKLFHFVALDHSSIDDFIDLVKPHLCESMKYKINPLFHKAKDPIKGYDVLRTLQKCKELIRNYQSLPKELKLA